MAKRTAINTALGITELLEAILEEVPPKDLLRCQRVCRLWKNTIDGSTKLQEALFFKAKVVEAIPMYTLLKQGDCRLNPCLEMQDRLWLPIITEAGGFVPIACSYHFHGGGEAAPAWGASEASWRRMFLCQPAVRSVIVDVQIEQYHRDNWKSLLLNRAEGIRAGDVIKRVEMMPAASEEKYKRTKCWLFAVDNGEEYNFWASRIVGTSREINLDDA